MSDAALLDVRGLSVEFEGIRALDDVTFTVPAGGVTAIIGPNGAGKTTLFNCVTGLYRGTGSIALEGRAVEDDAAHDRVALGIARTFQTPALVQETSVLDNVLLGAHHRMSGGLLAAAVGWPAVRREERQVRETARELLAALDDSLAADQPVAGLPHRERRIVEVARALLGRPRLLLLDEPAAGSTHVEAREMLDRICAVAETTGTTTVVVEHNVPLVMGLARKVVVLHHGRLLAAGTPDEVRADDRVVEAYLGTAA
jgi:branched-chain amino acid transport system ATP-binding protein